MEAGTSFFQKYFVPLSGEPHEHEDGAITLLKTRESQGGTPHVSIPHLYDIANIRTAVDLSYLGSCSRPYAEAWGSGFRSQGALLSAQAYPRLRLRGPLYGSEFEVQFAPSRHLNSGT